MMEIKEYKVLVVELKNEEIDNFKSVFDKLKKEISRVGFNDKKFNSKEMDIINKLSDE